MPFEIDEDDLHMVDEFGKFSNLTKFMGHEGKVAMCFHCGAILHANLMSFYPYKTCFNCGKEFTVVPFLIAEGIWWSIRNGNNIISWEMNQEECYAEITFESLPAVTPREWEIKSECFPSTNLDAIKNTIFLYVEPGDDDQDWFIDGLFCFDNWAIREFKNDKKH